MWRRVLGMIVTAMLAGCGGNAPMSAPVSGEWADLHAPAAIVDWPLPSLRPGTHLPRLAATHDGRLLLSWINSQRGRRHVFQFSSYDLAQQRWHGQPLTVVVGNSLLAQNNLRPQMLASGDGALWAQWVQKIAPGRNEVMVSRSRDGGANWSEPQMPYDARAYNEQDAGLFWPEAQGIGVAWMAGNEQGEVSLRAAQMDAGGRRGAEQILDAQATDCQRPGVAISARGPVLVYGASPVNSQRDEFRVVRVEAQGWTSPQLLHRDDGAYSNCPVLTGPVMGAHAHMVVAAWFSNDRPMGIHIAVSNDAGVSFSAPVELYRGEDAGVPLAVAVDAQQVWVLWEKMHDETDEANASLWLSRYRPDLQHEYERREMIHSAQGYTRTMGQAQLALAHGTGYLVWVKTRGDAISLRGVKLQAGQSAETTSPQVAGNRP